MEPQLQGVTPDRVPFDLLLRDNRTGIIEDPLRRIPEDHLNACIRTFYDKAELGSVIDFDTVIRAARLARDEEAFSVEEEADRTLTEVEKKALKREKHTTFWTESREIKVILLTCFVGSVLQGWVSECQPTSSPIKYSKALFGRLRY